MTEPSSIINSSVLVNTSVAAPPAGGNTGKTLPVNVSPFASKLNANDVSGLFFAASHKAEQMPVDEFQSFAQGPGPEFLFQLCGPRVFLQVVRARCHALDGLARERECVVYWY